MNKRQFIATVTAKEFSLTERAYAVAINTESFDRSEKKVLKSLLKRAQEVNAIQRKAGK